MISARQQKKKTETRQMIDIYICWRNISLEFLPFFDIAISLEQYSSTSSSKENKLKSLGTVSLEATPPICAADLKFDGPMHIDINWIDDEIPCAPRSPACCVYHSRSFL